MSLESVSEWLNGNSDKKIRITKQEQGDLDEVLLTLQRVDYRGEHTSAIDSYTSDHALLLHGLGVVINNRAELELPAGTFEIPLHGLSSIEIDPDTLFIETERAKYIMQVQ